MLDFAATGSGGREVFYSLGRPPNLLFFIVKGKLKWGASGGAGRRHLLPTPPTLQGKNRKSGRPWPCGGRHCRDDVAGGFVWRARLSIQDRELRTQHERRSPWRYRTDAIFPAGGL